MLKLCATSALHTPLGDTPDDLRAPLRAMTGQTVRRVNRFIELALLGALQCEKAAGGISADTALYLACDSPMLASSVEILKRLELERRPPSPFEFMNLSGNMAGYYIASHLRLDGPQLSVHRNAASLDAALDLVMLHQQPRALVGYVEEGSWPLPEQRRRIGRPPDAPLFEGSHWYFFDDESITPIALIEPNPAATHPGTQGLETARTLSEYLAGPAAAPLQFAPAYTVRKP